MAQDGAPICRPGDRIRPDGRTFGETLFDPSFRRPHDRHMADPRLATLRPVA